MRHATKAVLAFAALVAAGTLPARAQQDEAPPPEVKLTEETLKNVIAATKEMQSLDPSTAGGSEESAETTELDPQMETIAKKHGFADGEAYGQSYESAVQAFTVVDWTSEARKKEAAEEIAAINADAELDDKAKKDAIDQVEQDLAAPPPTALPENVALVKAHEAEMRELMTSDIGP